MSRSTRKAWRRLAGKAFLLAWGVLYTFLAVGVPISYRRIATTERFPCENCACGCSSASECWSGCCCHTLTERLAWAKRHGVTPPADVVARAAEAAPKKSCCQCSSNASATCSTAEDQEAPPEDSRVIGWRAWNCNGLSPKMLLVVPRLVIDSSELECVAPHLAWLGPPTSDRAISQPAVPAVPPPQSSNCG